MKETSMDIVERLRAGASTSPDVGSHMRKYQALCDEAADHIEAALLAAHSRAEDSMRERAAKVAEGWEIGGVDPYVAQRIATAIRALPGET
jgi:hypothetical protein